MYRFVSGDLFPINYCSNCVVKKKSMNKKWLFELYVCTTIGLPLNHILKSDNLTLLMIWYGMCLYRNMLHNLFFNSVHGMKKKATFWSAYKLFKSICGEGVSKHIYTYWYFRWPSTKNKVKHPKRWKLIFFPDNQCFIFDQIQHHICHILLSANCFVHIYSMKQSTYNRIKKDTIFSLNNFIGKRERIL